MTLTTRNYPVVPVTYPIIPGAYPLPDTGTKVSGVADTTRRLPVTGLRVAYGYVTGTTG